MGELKNPKRKLPHNLKIRPRPVASLVPYARNARTHSDAQIGQIAASIREFGFTNPVLVDGSNGIIAGHGRVLAAGMLGMTTVPTIELAHLTETQKRAYVLADNKLALNAGWDQQLLALELADLKAMGADLGLTGFGEAELAALLGGNAGLTDPDEVPELGKTAISRLGDVWRLGPHRLLCGDCTDPSLVEKALAGAKPQLMVTDPPYGVEYDPKWRHRAGVNVSKRVGKVDNDDRADWREAWALFPGDAVYVWHAALHATTVAESLAASGFQIRSQIVWAKDRLVLGRGDYHWQHEPCWYAVRKGAKGNWAGDRKQTTLWAIGSGGQDAETVHGTQKPVECMRRPMVNSSRPDEVVYEPFSGSGTTLIAAEMTGRVCSAIELNPLYVDVTVKRWECFTGKQAVLEASGESFEALGLEHGDAA